MRSAYELPALKLLKLLRLLKLLKLLRLLKLLKLLLLCVELHDGAAHRERSGCSVGGGRRRQGVAEAG